MSDSNTIAGWVLGAGIAALGLSIVSGKYFHADKTEHLEEPGYAIAGVVSSEDGADEGPALATLLASADVAAGEKQFSKCGSCHTINAGGAAGIGPNLHGVMGKGIASGSFGYSSALQEVGGNWTWEQMDAWIASPRKFANGTSMSFAGIGNAEDRAALLAYLNSQGSNLPLPEAPAEEAPAEGEDSEAAEGEAAEAEAPAEAAAQ